MKLVLASTSKIKNEILNKVGMKHSNVKSTFEEVSNNKENVYEYVKELAYGKACNACMDDKSIILGLDTIVYVNGKILEKPKSIDEAKQNLKICSSNTSYVITGIALINKYNNQIINDYAETKVILNDICDEDIEYYIENEPDVMYASGFVIETIASNFIKKIDGSFYNILGVPVEKIYEYLKDWNIYLKDLE